MLTKDPSSLSNPDEALVTHLNWDASVDFSTSIISATAIYDVEIRSTKTSSIKLDTSNLVIFSVKLNGTPAITTISTLDPEKEQLGECLSIRLPTHRYLSAPNSKVQVEIKYHTTDKCSAAQWLPPSQTAGGKRPYLFTQCQAIHARSLVPCQDTPGAKFTYKASVTAPHWATCVMSALSKGKEDKNSSTTTYQFDQPVPISSYLFALVVGELASRDISPRCRVWSEPSIIDSAAYEFADMETFLQIAEDLTLPYQWTRYDLLCLPPSFPYGGTENPCATFVTPTLLAGDRSLVDVVAHEIAHSWTGNLVTNATWEHFWLNEGWTMWLQRKIMARMHNDPKVFDMDAIGGWKALQESVAQFPDKFTKLVPDLGQSDPDDAFSSIPYEKGFNLLYALETRVGSVAFEDFAKIYLNKFKYRTITSEEFRALFESHFKDHQKCKDFDWEKWLHQPGMPIETPNFDATLTQAAQDLAQSWIDYKDGTRSSAPTEVNIEEWSSSQITCFLDALLSLVDEKSAPLDISTVTLINEQYKMSETKNSEILFRYCKLAIDAGDSSILDTAVRFIITQGRMKYVRPLYSALFESKMGKKIAIDTFLANANFYHPIASKMLAKDLSVQEESNAGPKEAEEVKQNSSKVPVAAYVGAGLTAMAILGLVLLRRRK